MPTTSGPGNAAVGGPFAEAEYEDWTASIVLANSASLSQGQAVIRDVTVISGIGGIVGPDGTPNPSNNSDFVVIPTASTGANAPIFGVYQGPTITNSTGASQTYTLLFRRNGYGQVLATAKTAGTAVTVGASLIIESGTDGDVLAGSAALNTTVGVATATGTHTTYGATIIAVPGSGATTALVNAHIDCK